MFGRTKHAAAGPRPRAPKALLGILCVFLTSLPFGALTGLLASARWLAGAPCLFCILICDLVYEKVLRDPGSQAGLWISAMISLAVCLAGLAASYVLFLYQMDLEYGYSLEQAIGLMPSALWDPDKLPHAHANRLSLLAAAGLALILGSFLRRTRRADTKI